MAYALGRDCESRPTRSMIRRLPLQEYGNAFWLCSLPSVRGSGIVATEQNRPRSLARDAIQVKSGHFARRLLPVPNPVPLQLTAGRELATLGTFAGRRQPS